MSSPSADAFASRVSADCPSSTREILRLSWDHDLAGLKKLLDAPGKASCQDLQTGETPLHAAIRSCGPVDGATTGSLGDATATVHELFLSGAIWNDVDDRDETPGCVAWRLGRTELYDLCVAAGVRAELLFGLLDGYEQLSSGSEADDDENAENGPAEQDDEAPELVIVDQNGHGDQAEEQETAEVVVEEEKPTFARPKADPEHDVKSETFLRSKLTYSDGKLVDDAGNGVMMAWETDIMRQSVDALLPGDEPGRRVLNVGFGMGIVDAMFASRGLARHHIVEAHPEVLERIAGPGSQFGAAWEGGGPVAGAYKVLGGRWQDVCPKLLEEGQIYDAIYFDTFGEDYGQLRKFFTEYIPGLLDEKGIFGFFNGLGADRRVCYDVYTKVVEMHLTDAGLDVDWKVIDVNMEGLDEAGKGEWAGVKRRYWTLDKYRLPICTFLG